MPKPPKQIPGCLPRGFDLDSMLTPEQFCAWRGVGREWFGSRIGMLPGVIRESRKAIRIHPRTYLDKSVRK